MILSQLHKEGRLLRIGKRPIYYLALQPLEISLKLRFPSNQYASLSEFEDFLASALIGAAQKSVQQTLSGDPFSQLIGVSGSLKQQIKQAKSALSYPPSGIHTLISGPVGAGKESFVRCMYYFALQKKTDPQKRRLNYLRLWELCPQPHPGHLQAVRPHGRGHARLQNRPYRACLPPFSENYIDISLNFKR
ncbi:sigma 54-interacting transcriptional regulator [uncultured Oscillibacter sp.]|uniref:sigma 54-interacting transcriptional regulator n=1 Tax=uncultured Oscillibacter sp. TaxID=876091 RepID=UPI002625430D|nr:sigma 54-interacting transcriptional regulator [uncultured Oscillibacter sp.]